MRDDMTEKTSAVRERKEFLDILRVAAVCAVVMMHTVSGVLVSADFTGFELRETVCRVLVDVTAWCVPVFLLISGYLFLDPGRQLTWRDMLGKYCRRILFALLLFGIPYSLLELVWTERAFRPGMLWEAVRNTATGHSWAHMWYLYLILVLYAVTPLLRGILERIPIVLSYLMAAALIFGFSLAPFWRNWKSQGVDSKVPGGGIFLFYYLCGYLFVRGERKRAPWVRGLCLVLFFAMLAGQTAVRLFRIPLADMAYSNPFTVIQSCLLFAGIRVRCQSTRWKRFWRELGALSFGIYLIHPVFLNFFYKFLGISLMNFRFLIGLPLFYGIALFGALLASWILRKIPVLRKYVL